jgi:hypothetical protein
VARCGSSGQEGRDVDLHRRLLTLVIRAHGGSCSGGAFNRPPRYDAWPRRFPGYQRQPLLARGRDPLLLDTSHPGRGSGRSSATLRLRRATVHVASPRPAGRRRPSVIARSSIVPDGLCETPMTTAPGNAMRPTIGGWHPTPCLARNRTRVRWAVDHVNPQAAGPRKSSRGNHCLSAGTPPNNLKAQQPRGANAVGL